MSTAHESFRDATPHSGAHTPPPTQAEFRAEHESLGEMFQSLSAKLSRLVSQEIADPAQPLQVVHVRGQGRKHGRRHLRV